MNESLVSAKWLQANLTNPDLVVLDASSAKIMSGLRTENSHEQIIGARKFDLKTTFSDTSSPFPTMLPTAAEFQKECRELGINNQSIIVVYDNLGIYTSPRVWWMFKVMGHEKVFVLDGGMPGWKKLSCMTETPSNQAYHVGNFEAELKQERVKSSDFIAANISSQAAILIDARSAQRFRGAKEEPRKGLRSGHIPKSLNIPYDQVLEDGFFKSTALLKALFSTFGIGEQPVVFTCGSGVTACIVLLAFEQVRNNLTAIYDGSWTEWATLHPH